MRSLNIRARSYIIASYVGGLAALLWLVLSYGGPGPRLSDWLLAAGLAAAAAICQVFVVARTSTRGQRSDHLTPAPIFAALLLLPRPLLAIVLIVTWLPEWYIHRRTWYPQLWNIAAYLIAGAVARAAFLWLTGFTFVADPGFSMVSNPLPVLALIPLFFGLQTLMLAWVFRFARGISFRESGLFQPGKLLDELGIICVGLGFAVAWVLNPWYGLAAALPLVLIFQALHVPNLKQEAATDPKTGLANMRHFNMTMAKTLERAERTVQPFSLLMCDLDYLRNINNTYGHQAGDVVLIGIADVLRQHMGEQDVAARFGGEEFAVLLADADASRAYEIAECVRRDFEQARFDVKHAVGQISATLSIGVASYPLDGRTPEALLHEADLAVYQAKRAGRNRVVVAGRESRELAAEWAREHLVPASESTAPRPATTTSPFVRFVNQVTRKSINADLMPSARSVQRGSEAAGAASPALSSSTRSGLAPAVMLFIATIVGGGLLGLLPGLPVVQVPWQALVLFAVLTVVASELAVDTYGKGKTSVATVVKLSAALLFGELGIAATALASAATLKVKARSPIHRMLFNFGTFLLSAEGARACFIALVGPTITERSLGSMIVPAVVAGLVYYAINHVLLCLIRGLSERRLPWQIWRADYQWLWPHYAVLGALSLIVALGYLHFGALGVVSFMAPVAMMHLAIKQYMDRTAVHVSELRQLNDRLTDSYEATLLALTRALDTRDEETEEHSQRVKRYTHLIASRLDLSTVEREDILRGALLHDIGKIGVPDAILLKPGKLTDEERDLMRKHPQIGYGMIAHIPFLAGAARIVLHHHEAYDGTGYPSGLSGDRIPLGARIFAVADTFDAMTSDRPYRKALSTAAARAEIARCSGAQFDPAIVETFLAIPDAELMAVHEDQTTPIDDPVLHELPSLVLAHG